MKTRFPAVGLSAVLLLSSIPDLRAQTIKAALPGSEGSFRVLSSDSGIRRDGPILEISQNPSMTLPASSIIIAPKTESPNEAVETTAGGSLEKTLESMMPRSQTAAETARASDATRRVFDGSSKGSGASPADGGSRDGQPPSDGYPTKDLPFIVLPYAVFPMEQVPTNPALLQRLKNIMRATGHDYIVLREPESSNDYMGTLARIVIDNGGPGAARAVLVAVREAVLAPHAKDAVTVDVSYPNIQRDAQQEQKLIGEIEKTAQPLGSTHNIDQLLKDKTDVAVLANKLVAKLAVGELKSELLAALSVPKRLSGVLQILKEMSSQSGHQPPNEGFPTTDLPLKKFTATIFPDSKRRFTDPVAIGRLKTSDGEIPDYIIAVPSSGPDGAAEIGTLCRLKVISADPMTLELDGIREARIVKTSDGSVDVDYPKIERAPNRERALLGSIVELARSHPKLRGIWELINGEKSATIIANTLVAKLALRNKADPSVSYGLLSSLSIPDRLDFALEQLQDIVDGADAKKTPAAAAIAKKKEPAEKKGPVANLQAIYETKKDKLSAEARAAVEEELNELKNMNPASAEGAVLSKHIKALLSMPWELSSKENNDIGNAKIILDADHFGLKKPKKKILEHLAVSALGGNQEGEILLLAGPPGVGKTSLGKSIARATNRPFVRISMGGVRDEAKVRGHIKTYVGAMFGQFIAAIKKAGVNNPVIQIDEVDKVDKDSGNNGGAMAALLELLDPEQNKEFEDHYLGVPFDFSKVLFVATANTLATIPAPLLDRFDIVQLSGYTDAEKLSIAKSHLVPKQLERTGLAAKHPIEFPDATLTELIARYTREAGVRGLERTIGSVAKAVALNIRVGKGVPSVIQPGDLKGLIGQEKVSQDRPMAHDQPGIASGLAWTESGGEVLSIETAYAPKGTNAGMPSVTGNIEKVMAESVSNAWKNAVRWSIKHGVDENVTTNYDFSLHIPAGAVPKDGPSAGITMTTAYASLFTGRPVRPKLAMTGEVTLTGKVLPIGGLESKALAALKNGYTDLIIPRGNLRDVEEMPPEVKAGIVFHPVDVIDEVLDFALVGEGTPMSLSDSEPQRRRMGF